LDLAAMCRARDLEKHHALQQALAAHS
jgi:hypothetical protein